MNKILQNNIDEKEYRELKALNYAKELLKQLDNETENQKKYHESYQRSLKGKGYYPSMAFKATMQKLQHG